MQYGFIYMASALSVMQQYFACKRIKNLDYYVCYDFVLSWIRT